MFSIKCQQLGKKFGRDWVFRNLDLDLNVGDSIVLLGKNGSGKSTLLKTLVGNITPSKGSIRYTNNETLVDTEKWYKHVAIAAPYLDLYEELTLLETINTHRQFKRFQQHYSSTELIEIMQLEANKNKALGAFSSGMKQRVKLALAILSDTAILALDEPGMNLDKLAIKWFQDLLEQHRKNRIIITCSNEQHEEYLHANKKLDILSLK